jgi:hypothetical protein
MQCLLNGHDGLEAGLPQPREVLPDGSSPDFEDNTEIDSSSIPSSCPDTELENDENSEEELAGSITARIGENNGVDASSSERASPPDATPSTPLSEVALLQQLLRRMRRKKQFKARLQTFWSEPRLGPITESDERLSGPDCSSLSPTE